MSPVNAGLLVGTTLRLTRLIVADELGGWVLREPAERWADRQERDLYGPRHKLVDGLGCPFCVGFWVGVGVLAAQALVGRSPAWRFAMAALTLNELVGRVTLLEEYVEEEGDPEWAAHYRDRERKHDG